MPDAFYVPDGDAFVATVHTRGPWSATHQHGGPPAALLARALEAQAPGFVIPRITVDFLLPVPIDRHADLAARARAGRRRLRQWRERGHRAQALHRDQRRPHRERAPPAGRRVGRDGLPVDLRAARRRPRRHPPARRAWSDRPRAPEPRGGGAVFVRQIAVLPSRSPRARYGRSFGPPHLTDRMQSGSEPWR